MKDLRRFRAESLPAALQKVKRELGPEAVILSTQTVRRAKGAFGLFGGPLVEVTAAASLKPAARGHGNGEGNGKGEAPPKEEALGPLRREVQALRLQLEELGRALAEKREREEETLSPLFLGLLGQMVAKGLEPELAREVATEAQRRLSLARRRDPGEARLCAADVLVGRLGFAAPRVAGERGPRVVALFGPTGAGKTLTAAKLAADATWRGRLRVGLLALDPGGEGGLEALRPHALALKLPLLEARSAEDFHKALATYRGADLVLVDTPGRSPREAGEVGELARSLAAGENMERHLVLAAHTAREEMGRLAETFRPLSPDRLLFTKLDEASRFGIIIHQQVESGLPLSYFATGRAVPEDLETARPERVADLIFEIAPRDRPGRDAHGRVSEPAAPQGEGP